MLAQLVAEPSVSSTSPDIDRSNLRVMNTCELAGWLGLSHGNHAATRATGKAN